MISDREDKKNGTVSASTKKEEIKKIQVLQKL
jgi:hypothetical protein